MRCKIVYCLWFLFVSVFLLRPFVLGQQEDRKERFRTNVKRMKWDKQRRLVRKKTSLSEVGSGLRVKTELVNLDVVVTNKQGKLIDKLNKYDFLVSEDRISQTTDFFSAGTQEEGLSIVLIIDRSSSVGQYTKDSLEALDRLIEMLRPQDRLAIATDDVELLCDYTSDKAQLRHHAKKLQAGLFLDQGIMISNGESRQMDALVSALMEVDGEEADHPIIIFQTDGDQIPGLKDKPCGQKGWLCFYHRRSRYSSQDIKDLISWSPAKIYTVITSNNMANQPIDRILNEARWLVTGLLPGPVPPRQDTVELREMLDSLPKIDWVEIFNRWQTYLSQIAESSGGWAVFLNQSETAEEIYTRIFSETHKRYFLAYYPTNTARDGKWREVKIMIKDHPEYIVRGRKGYYAAKD
jgi:VWFA-related protein